MKPSLAELLKKAELQVPPPKADTVAVIPPAPPTTPPERAAPVPDKELLPWKRTTAKERKQPNVKIFVKEYIASSFNVTRAFKTFKPDASSQHATSGGLRMLRRKDVKAELNHQLEVLFQRLDLTDEYVLQHMKDMAESSIFDYLKADADGKLTWSLDPDKLTPAQQRNIRSVKCDKETGAVVEVRLVSREQAVDMLAKARKLYRETEGARQTADLANLLMDRLAQAASRVGRTFDEDGRLVQA